MKRAALARSVEDGAPVRPKPRSIKIGKDLLELLSSSMYVDPLTIYREYVQNAADSLDLAKAAKLVTARSAALHIDIDAVGRRVRLRDNGTGIETELFQERLLSMGSSTKRGTAARGFRGVGRLAGLGYCQELIFRSRANGEDAVSEMTWDCRQLRTLLRGTDNSKDLSALVRDVVSCKEVTATSDDAHFFEVELRGVVRHRDDRLLNPSLVAGYLAQCAPVPFASDFQFGEDIGAALAARGIHGDLQLLVSGVDGPVVRPHKNDLGTSQLVIHEIPSIDGDVAAIGWVLHHEYIGAIAKDAGVKGLRLRSGNIQVGDAAIIDDLFPETRFNSWAVGEVHVLDRRIVPNGRRDNFEQSVHFDNLLNHVAPIARDIARRCRDSSDVRRRLRQFELNEASVNEKLASLRRPGLRPAARKGLLKSAENLCVAMEKIISKPSIAKEQRSDLQTRLEKLRKKLGRAGSAPTPLSPLDRLPSKERATYERVFELIYECAGNKSNARSLIDKILTKIS